MIRTLILAVVALTLAQPSLASEVVTYPAPPDEPRSPDFEVWVDGKPVDVYGMPSPNFADMDGDGDMDLQPNGDRNPHVDTGQHRHHRPHPLAHADRHAERDVYTNRERNPNHHANADGDFPPGGLSQS